MKKKVYLAPTIELFEFETEGCLLSGSVKVGVAKDSNQQVIEVDAAGALTNKREPGNPWSSSPWE